MKPVKLLGITLAAAVAMGASLSHAQEAQKAYAGVSYVNATLDGAATFNMPLLAVQAGMDISDTVQVEARYAFSRGDDTQEYESGSYTYVETVEVTQYWALLAKIHLPVAEGLSVYGILGLNHMTLEGAGHRKNYSSSKFWGEYSETGATFGAGVAYTFNDTISLNAEYQSMVKDVTGLTVGVNYRF